jgi:hypothetical protein
MRPLIFVALGLSVVSTFAFGASHKKELLNDMVKSCKTELASSHVKMSDPEVVWGVLEKIETSGGNLSADCDKAEEAYEKKYHNETCKAKEAKEAAETKSAKAKESK